MIWLIAFIELISVYTAIYYTLKYDDVGKISTRFLFCWFITSVCLIALIGLIIVFVQAMKYLFIDVLSTM